MVTYNADLSVQYTVLDFQTAETVESIVVQLMEKQRAARTAALNKQLECGCPDSLAGADRTCPHHGPSPTTNNRYMIWSG